MNRPATWIQRSARRSLNRERGTTLIIVTHDPTIAAQTERVIRLMDGHLENTTSPVQLAGEETSEEQKQVEAQKDVQKGNGKS